MEKTLAYVALLTKDIYILFILLFIKVNLYIAFVFIFCVLDIVCVQALATPGPMSKNRSEERIITIITRLRIGHTAQQDTSSIR